MSIWQKIWFFLIPVQMAIQVLGKNNTKAHCSFHLQWNWQFYSQMHTPLLISQPFSEVALYFVLLPAVFKVLQLTSCFFFWLLHFINIVHKWRVSDLSGIVTFTILMLSFSYCLYSTSREEKGSTIKWRSIHLGVNAHSLHHAKAYS